MFSLFKTKPKQTREKDITEIAEVVDQLAYKYSIPQYIIRNIIMTWMDYSHKRMGLE